jgi:ATP-dependent Clp protease adaptor protein ClpS
MIRRGSGARDAAAKKPNFIKEKMKKPPYSVVVWDDPINLMDFVTYVFQNVLDVNNDTAKKLMLKVHKNGKTTVYAATQKECEQKATKLLSYGLWATIQAQEQY